MINRSLLQVFKKRHDLLLLEFFISNVMIFQSVIIQSCFLTPLEPKKIHIHNFWTMTFDVKQALQMQFPSHL